jgi:lipid-binding SYLF domain-containing protein
LGLLGLAMLCMLVGCGSTPTAVSSEEKPKLNAMVQSTIAEFKATDPGMSRFLDSAYAYAVFPDVGSGAFIVGGAHGNGEVYRAGKLDGYADVSKANVGAQIGGQSYSQIVFFENSGSYAKFTGGNMEFDANASAVAASAGASTSANYQNGVLVFTKSKGGLMAAAAVGGQKFRYIKLTESP